MKKDQYKLEMLVKRLQNNSKSILMKIQKICLHIKLLNMFSHSMSNFLITHVTRKGHLWIGDSKIMSIIKTTLGQSKKGNVITKTFGVIKTFNIQHVEDATKDFKWDVSYQKFLVRLIFNFVKHGPVWIYFKDDEECQKFYDYFKCHMAMDKIQKLPTIIQESMSLVKENYLLQFAQRLETYSIHVIQQRKKAAKLGKEEAKFLMEIDVKIIRNILQKKWLNKSVQFFKREERMNQLADEERKKLEQIRQEDENKNELALISGIQISTQC